MIPRSMVGYILAGLSGLVLIAALIGCGDESKPEGPAARMAGPAVYPYQVVCTTGMITDIVARVAGPHATVRGIIGAGVDPHLYKATRNDIAALQSADVVFYNGLTLEGKLADVLRKVAEGGRPVHAVTKGLASDYLVAPDGAAGHADPHVWMDVAGWMQAVDTVAAELAAFDPAHGEEYRAQAASYRVELAALDTYVRRVIGTIPAGQRVLITAHDAFHYFGRAYDVTVLGIQGISTESEAGLDDINRLVAYIVEHEVPAIFVESSVADRNVRAIVEGVAARGRELVIGGMLFSDAMGAAGTYEGTYVGMIDHNATVIARALGGEVPRRGHRGQLAFDGE